MTYPLDRIKWFMVWYGGLWTALILLTLFFTVPPIPWGIYFLLISGIAATSILHAMPLNWFERVIPFSIPSYIFFIHLFLYYTGGTASPYIPLSVLPIILASFFYRYYGAASTILLTLIAHIIVEYHSISTVTQYLTSPHFTIMDLPFFVVMLLVAILVAFIAGEMKKDKEGLQSLFNEVEKSKKICELTFDSAIDLISVHDKEYRIVKVNRAICDKFNMKPQELIGRKCYEVFHKTDLPIPFCPHEETMRTKEPASSEVDDPNMGGIFNMCTAPMFDEKGEFVGSVHIARDITKEREKQRQLIQSEKLATLGTMISGFAHEINNPLTSVVGYAELLLDDNGLNEDAKRYVKLIYNESIRAAKISSNFILFAREHKPIKDWTNIHEILEATTSLRTYFLHSIIF